ncbi:MAG TPA: hypothetical protein VGG33_01710 [Polyangia bacterium]
MDATKLQLKIFAVAGGDTSLEAFIPVLHRFIKEHKLPELLVDVANYAHVPQGPGVVLIGHGSDYFIDEADGRRGLLFNRKRQAPAPELRLQDTFARAVQAAIMMEAEPALAGKLKFDTSELLFRINDRLLAPNNDATFAAHKNELAAFCTRLFGENGFTFARVGEERQRFSVAIKPATPLSLKALFDKLGGVPAVGAAAA